MASKKEKKAQKQAEAKGAEEPKLNPQRVYVECQDTETGEPIMLELPPRILQVIKDLRSSLVAHGDAFGKQIIRAVRYIQAPDGRLAQQELAKGKPAEVIKQLEDQCLNKEALEAHMAHALRVLSRVSGLRAAALTFLVEEGDDVVTGGTTTLFVPAPTFSDAEMTQLINSVHAHGDQLKTMAEKEGRKVATQDDVKLIKPGDAGFRMPPKGMHPKP